MTDPFSPRTDVPQAPLLRAQQAGYWEAGAETYPQGLEHPGFQWNPQEPTDPQEVGPRPDPGPDRPAPVPAAWSAEAARRRAWLGRAALLVILLAQALLSVRLHNTAFQDEALYIYAGHMEIAHIFHGAPLVYSYASYFSGSPALYPVLAGAVDSVLGVDGVRAVSLLFMLGATALIYSTSRRLFNERVALFGTGLFASAQSTIVLGWFATYDAPALFLITLAAWLVVRFARAHAALVLLAVPVLVLAFCTKYASGIFIPPVIGLAVLTAWPYRQAAALWRAVLLCVGTGVLGVAVLYHSQVMTGIQATTTSRQHGTNSTSSLINMSADWTWVMLAAACWGSISYIRRGRLSEISDVAARTGETEPGRYWRALLCLLLFGSALLAPAYQIHLSTSISLYKHVGFGLVFVAPLAGLGLSRIVGPHFLRIALGVAVLAVALFNGVEQSGRRYATWPDSSQLISVLRPHVTSGGKYLADVADVPIFYFRDVTAASRWDNTYVLKYTDSKGVRLSGPAAYTAAVDDGKYDMVVLDSSPSANDTAIDNALAASGKYHLAATVPYTNTNGRGAYTVWIKG
ncbi:MULTISPECIES: glycosyltransferase family 39 protein [Streptacidiphilus]|uniref:ArnT family glycosyltransferase n=2 Tax=Streptacidiphilus TaxID=228398 RepID=A0ABV6UGM0_9ACTN|nr:glycosyltransferase family 39 protein [Streptacidiphilus jeojiense]